MRTIKNAMSPQTTGAERTRYDPWRALWKSAIVFAGVSLTALGWLVQPRHKELVQSQPVSAAVRIPTHADAANQATPLVVRSAPPLMLQPLPSMSQRPVFEEPVTRTRRS